MKNEIEGKLEFKLRALAEMVQLEDCYELNCQCTNNPNLRFKEFSLKRGMDPYEVYLQIEDYPINNYGQQCLMNKLYNLLNN